ncbi:MAG: hypothetical protein ABFS86_00975 [Planctomycetota bacterium]
MVPSSRGSAGTVALVLASVFLLFAVWLLAGRADAPVDRAIETLNEDRDPGVTGPEAQSLLDRADALSQELHRQVDIVPGGTALARSAPGGAPPEQTSSPPGVAGLEGRIEDSSIVLTWRAAGDEPAEGYLIERLAATGELLSRAQVGPDAFRHRDGPVDALRGIRIYRVTALGRDGTVAGLQQKKVSFRQEFTVDYLGSRAGGTARFRVNWLNSPGGGAGQRISEEFDVAIGDGIGGKVPGKGDRPDLDFGTGWRFTGFAGRRKIETREAGVPRFSADGSLVRDPDTGRAVFEVRKMPVVDVVEGAGVEAPRDDGTTGLMWLEKAQ